MKSSGAKDFWSLGTILNMRRAFRCNVRDSGADCNPPAKLWIQIDYELPLTYNKVEVGGNQQLASLVEITGIEAQTIKDLNPKLLQSSTPPGENRFRIKLPVGNGAIAELLQPKEKQPESADAERRSSRSRGSTRPDSSLDWRAAMAKRLEC
jgi:hypothetical protein